MAKKQKIVLTSDIITILQKRFENNMHRHPNINWDSIEKIIKKPAILRSLEAMESSGGEPDVFIFDIKEKNICFVDFAIESPSGRRSFCYDKAAWNTRKEHKPKNNAIDLAKEMGIELLNEEEYRAIQDIEAIDLKTSSWIETPERIRKLGGALFCDRRFDTVFTYHNGAESYYAARGFRGKLILK